MLHSVRLPALIAAATLLATPYVRADPAENSAALKKLADGVLQQTTRRLINRETGETFTNSAKLDPRPEISIESKFNAWFYQTWLLTDGMRRVHLALGDDAYKNYGETNLDFIYQHLDYFKRQNAARMKAAPVGDGVLSPIAFHFAVNHSWHSGLAPLVLERHAASKNNEYEPYLKRMREYLKKCPRRENGLIYRPNKGAMTDDPYMVVAFMARDWKLNGNKSALDDAIVQVLGTHELLFIKEDGLYKHMWDIKTAAPGGHYWGRGNGWMVLAFVELISWIPDDHPRRDEVLTAYREFMTGLRRWQNPKGGWHQVIDKPKSWIETSCTGMSTYGLARGVNEGWLDSSFEEAARLGWSALQTKLTPEADLLDVCASTDVGDLNYYLNRPRLQGDLHGFGSFLLAGAEIVRMDRRPARR